MEHFHFELSKLSCQDEAVTVVIGFIEGTQCNKASESGLMVFSVNVATGHGGGCLCAVFKCTYYHEVHATT